MEQLLARGCKSIALQPVVGPPTADMVRKAKEAGVPVIAYNSSIPSSDVKGFVARNNFAVGKSIAEEAQKQGVLRGRWAIVVMNADASQFVPDVFDLEALNSRLGALR
jgi:D-xylose transport system substrate-binding protein